MSIRSSRCLSSKCFKHLLSWSVTDTVLERDEVPSHVGLQVRAISHSSRDIPCNFSGLLWWGLCLYHESSSKSDSHVSFYRACFYELLGHVPILILSTPGLRSFKAQVSLKAKINPFVSGLMLFFWPFWSEASSILDALAGFPWRLSRGDREHDHCFTALSDRGHLSLSFSLWFGLIVKCERLQTFCEFAGVELLNSFLS